MSMKCQTFLFCLGTIIASVDAFASPISLIGRRSVGGVRSPTVVLSPSTSTTTELHAGVKGIELSGLLYDSTSTAFDAWEW